MLFPPDNIGRLAPCNHKEADTRMLLHAADAVQCGFTKILLRTVDTDVLILAVAFAEELQEFQGNQTIELWVGFGTGAHLRLACVAGVKGIGWGRRIRAGKNGEVVGEKGKKERLLLRSQFCLQYSNGTPYTTMFIYGRVGQPSHRAVYLTYMQKNLEKTEAPKADTKTPKNHQVEKNTGNVYPRPRQCCNP